MHRCLTTKGIIVANVNMHVSSIAEKANSSRHSITRECKHSITPTTVNYQQLKMNNCRERVSERKRERERESIPCCQGVGFSYLPLRGRVGAEIEKNNNKKGHLEHLYSVKM